jgi:hypothetical protein
MVLSPIAIKGLDNRKHMLNICNYFSMINLPLGNSDLLLLLLLQLQLCNQLLKGNDLLVFLVLIVNLICSQQSCVKKQRNLPNKSNTPAPTNLPNKSDTPA